MNNEFTSAKLDKFFKNLLDLNTFAAADSSMNGLQADNDGGVITKIAFAVDASLETFKRAAGAGAGMLFVHHGLFWGKSERLIGGYRDRIKFLLDHNLCLYGVHLPLDQHPVLGNNAVLAKLLGLENMEPFGLYRGHKIGYKGSLSKPLTTEEAAAKIGFMGRPPLGIYSFGKKINVTAAVVSGGAAEEMQQALEEGVDLFITGEISHSFYNQALEGKLNYIAGGHYSTEVWGVRSIMEETEKQLHIDTEFIDVPTGL
ncbi:MAG: Nif3-like dinuclear metal center hexameric protein [Treponema sp.]|nr:Nif3-like dinuclear metal center hexameric protein [Treponema sp.]